MHDFYFYSTDLIFFAKVGSGLELHAPRHCAHGNYRTAAKGVASGIALDKATGGLNILYDAPKTLYQLGHDSQRTEYQGRGRPRNSDYSYNGYHAQVICTIGYCRG